MGMIWDLYGALTRRLLWWSVGSILGGLALLLWGDTFWRAFGVQAAAWGAVDAVIALLGRWASRRRRRAYPDPQAAEVVDREATKLRRLLLFNTALDALYVAGGLILALTLGKREASWQGHGWGIVAQGGFLFLFDLVHAQLVPFGVLSGISRFYQGTEHRSFLWPGGKPAALMVHGFLGSPGEMRPLAEALHKTGWTVEGILLPGFGPEIETLPKRRHEEWLATVENALAALQRDHSPVLVVAHSMGAALSICTAARRAGEGRSSPDGLILLAPFTRLVPPVQKAIWVLLRLILPRYVRVLEQNSFPVPNLRQWFADLTSQVDVKDAEVQQEIREASLPVAVLFELQKSGREAFQYADQVQSPTLILQGRLDPTVRPKDTRRLVDRFPNKVNYIEVNATHLLMLKIDRAYTTVEQDVVRFAESVLKSAQ
jgi:carboxylesterase